MLESNFLAFQCGDTFNIYGAQNASQGEINMWTTENGKFWQSDLPYAVLSKIFPLATHFESYEG